jgi:hypothetical protein
MASKQFPPKVDEIARITYREFVRLMDGKDSFGHYYRPFDALSREEQDQWRYHVANVQARLPSRQLVV